MAATADLPSEENVCEEHRHTKKEQAEGQRPEGVSQTG
jgi:hypothetical protein